MEWIWWLASIAQGIWAGAGLFLPITASIAICLFVAREVLEFFKKRGADSRKLAAIKRVVARDLEINQWILCTYRTVLHGMQRVDTEPGRVMRITSGPGNRFYFEHWEGDEPEESRSGCMFLPIVDGNINKYLMEAATLDEKLLTLMEETSTALAEMDHVRLSAMRQVDTPVHRDGFIDYGLAELAKDEEKLLALYRYCTGKTELKGRVR